MKNSIKCMICTKVGTFVALLALLTFWGCQKLDITPENDGLELIQQGQSDFQVFNSIEDFKATYEKIGAMNQKELSSYEAAHHGFTSMREAYNEILGKLDALTSLSDLDKFKNTVYLTEGNEPELLIQEENPILSEIINENGLVQIGDTIFRYAHDRILKIPETKRQEIPLMFEQIIPSTSVIIVKIKGKEYGKTLSPRASVVDYDYISTTRRLKGELVVNNLGTYAEWYAQNTHQRKSDLGFWYASTADHLTMNLNWIGYEFVNTEGTYFYGSSNDTGTAVSSIYRLVRSKSGYPWQNIYYVVENFDGYFNVTYNNGQSASLNLYW